jgi:hypothetical protein
MIRPLAFCGGLALAWCSTAGAGDFDKFECTGNKAACLEALKQVQQSTAADATRVEIDDLKERVTQLEGRAEQLEGLIKALPALPECSGDPPAHEPCIERQR